MDYIDALEEVAEAARTIFDVVSQTHKRPPVMCPHGNWPQYPTYAWWCDECFRKLENDLYVLEESRNASLTHAADLTEQPSAYCVDCGGSEYHSETCGHYEPPGG